MLPVHGLKRAAKKMRWLFHFWEFSVSKHLYSKRVSDVQPLSLFSRRRDNGKRHVLRAEEKLTTLVELESVVREKPKLAIPLAETCHLSL
jgi:hypothetical protein